MTEQIRESGSPTESGRTSPADPADHPGRGSGEMLAMVLTNDRKTRLEHRPVPTPRDDQVLVDVDLCGICGSDLHAPDLSESGRSVLVVGAVHSGSCAAGSRDTTGQRVWLSEPSAERRSYAEALQADRAFDPTIEAADIERLKADVALECSGSEAALICDRP
jgi:threonine dehydrogenase-like Zn-dependent dehydrogenase